MGADEGTFGDYFVVRDNTEGELTGPAEPGMYEIRYLLREGNKTLASEMMEITTPTVTLSGPPSVVTGAKFDVSWTGTINQQDYVAIVPAGSDEGEFGNYIVVRDNDSGTLVAPADPGLYELRYILREGSKTMARADIEVAEPEVTVSGPETALAGSKFKVTWTGTVSQNDYINIVPMGTDEGDFGNYFVVRGNTEGELQAPAETGLYELRYVLREGNKTLATGMVEIVEPEVSVSAPAEVRAGSDIKVSWTGTVDQSDYINLVPAGMDDGEFGVYSVVRNQTETELKVPDETGLYEVRYMLREGGRVLARATVEVLGEDAQLSTGAAVDAPETAAAGASITVGWTIDTPSADQRITVARADQAIFTWISATRITGDPPMQITMPGEPGSYEIRILDLVAKEVLARKTIKVE
jgi:Ca-activated chloride channel family protein